MGYKTEFNWVLKLKKEQGFPERLEEGAAYSFSKKEKRVYPVGIPVFLADSSWHVSASVVVREFCVKEDETRGVFVVSSIFTEDDAKIITRIVREMYEKRV